MLARPHGVTVAGGDMTSCPTLVLAITAVGRAVEGVPPARRSGARPGDVLCVTGALGAAAAGLLLLDDPGLLARPARSAPPSSTPTGGPSRGSPPGARSPPAGPRR